jgi:hypothetical protein
MDYDTRSLCGSSFTVLGASASSTAHTTLCFAASLVGDSPHLAVLSSRWTFHFHELQSMPWTIV